MNLLHVLYQIARADFYERVRRYSFLIILGLSVFLSFQVAAGEMTLTVGNYRGEYNSAWIGAELSVIATFSFGWFGFFVIKGSIARDYQTGIGQIMASTPLTRPCYMFGKWLSNLAVLAAMTGVLALLGLGIQIWFGENLHIDLMPYLTLFVWITLPALALVAALAVLFEAIPFLRGGLGNVIYFFGFVSVFPIFLGVLSPACPGLEPLGVGLLSKDMGAYVQTLDATYAGGFALGPPSETVTATFFWPGLQWTPEIILARLALVAVAALIVLLAALFFDRFDPVRARSFVQKALPVVEQPQPVNTSRPASGVRLGPLSTAARRFNFFDVLRAELKLLLKGLRWWWYVVAGGLIVAGLASPAALTREAWLPLAWAWPLLIWSALGNRELRHNVQQITFAVAGPVWRQLPAQWLAGFLLALLTGSGALLRLLIAADLGGLLALFSGALFIPSLALAAGVWSENSKLFEIVYISLLYMGPLSRIPAADFSGAISSGHPEFFVPLALFLLALAALGRLRQVRS